MEMQELLAKKLNTALVQSRVEGVRASNQIAERNVQHLGEGLAGLIQNIPFLP
jgi:hypothetical protein